LLRDRPALIGGVLVVVVLSVAVGAPLFANQDPLRMEITNPLQPPSPEHVLGTDNFGRDLWARIAYGSRNSLVTAVSAVVSSGLIGIPLGLASGYYGGFFGALIMRIVDVFLAFPFILLAIALVAVLGPSGLNVVIALSLVFWTQYARVVRASVMDIRHQDFVEAALAIGASDRRIMTRHILPNVSAPIIVVATLGMGTAVIAESTLGFLGLGAPPPTPTWGGTLAFGLTYLTTAPGMSVYTGIAIMISVLGFNLLGEGLRDVWDPRLRNR